MPNNQQNQQNQENEVNPLWVAHLRKKLQNLRHESDYARYSFGQACLMSFQLSFLLVSYTSDSTSDQSKHFIYHVILGAVMMGSLLGTAVLMMHYASVSKIHTNLNAQWYEEYLRGDRNKVRTVGDFLIVVKNDILKLEEVLELLDSVKPFCFAATMHLSSTMYSSQSTAMLAGTNAVSEIALCAKKMKI